MSYGNFLLGYHDGTVLASDTKRGDVRGSNGLERIFCHTNDGQVMSYSVSGGLSHHGVAAGERVQRTDLVQTTLV